MSHRQLPKITGYFATLTVIVPKGIDALKPPDNRTENRRFFARRVGASAVYKFPQFLRYTKSKAVEYEYIEYSQ